ncbi:hypothetical protein VB264_05295 [Arcicella aquatica]|uniref:Uncharacterized protein n=1 Tax=Arcicella aquatica TaxID=217141 RepID=A0ABU5QJF1_9BACT|nr:hypothetical protein [Arcicella aquatica]MEA5257192.1 hypothetical protein [Arcicella aquatica]
MALQKYRLINCPENGIKFESQQGTIILDKNLTDDEAKALLDGKIDIVKQYIEEVDAHRVPSSSMNLLTP